MSAVGEGSWKRRLGLSIVYSALAVILSTMVFFALSSFQNPDNTGQNDTSGIEIVADVLGFPLVAGWMFVSVVFGGWRAFHQGQILLLIPLVSIMVDSLLIFLVWEFFHRKMSRELASDSVLHIDR